MNYYNSRRCSPDLKVNDDGDLEISGSQQRNAETMEYKARSISITVGSMGATSMNSEKPNRKIPGKSSTALTKSALMGSCNIICRMLDL